MEIFTHFILTRFNVVDRSGYGVSYDYLNSDEYLSARFQLFDTYCFPSISGQCNKNFKWFVLFNEQLPEKWRKKMYEHQKQCPNLEIRYMSSIPDGKWISMLNEFIINELSALKNSPAYILTTRIDNDDAFHLSFVDRIQKYFLAHQQEMLINYTNGLQYIPKYNVLKNITLINGHFGTLAESNNSNVNTVLSFPHNPLPEWLPAVKNLNTKTRMWLETAHDTNVFNTPWFNLRHILDDLFFIGFRYRNLNDFGIKQNIPRINPYTWEVFFNYVVKKFKIKIINRILHR